MSRGAVDTAPAKMPTGLFVVSSLYNKQIAVMTASWVYQGAFEPPLIAMGMQKDRAISSPVKLSGGFDVSVLKRDQDDLERHFAQHFDPKLHPPSGGVLSG